MIGVRGMGGVREKVVGVTEIDKSFMLVVKEIEEN